MSQITIVALVLFAITYLLMMIFQKIRPYIVGASANITGIGILRKEGYEVKATTFMKYGVPFTMAAVITGYLLLWFIWG